MISWTLISSFDEFGASVYESKRNELNQIDEVYDWAIFFNSSEDRTLEYSKLLKENSVVDSLLVDFKNNKCSLKEENLKRNLECLSHISQNNPKIIHDIDIFNYEENLELILSHSPSSLSKVSSKCFIEITGVPLIYSTALFRPLKLKIPRSIINFLNVSAEYDKGMNCNYQFSDGIKENIYIPGYYGRPDFSKPWVYIFLLGFEGDRSLSILKKNQPEFIEAIIAEPGYQDGYFSVALDINKAFLNEAGFTEMDIHKVDAGNPIEVCNCILELYNKYEKISNICLVPLGTKPHAIGACMAAMLKNDIAIMYQVPKKYSINNTKSGERIWLYEYK